MSKKVGIILINYKDYAVRFLSECRDSLRAQNYPIADFKVYIVDNASSEESRKYLADNYSEAQVIPRLDGSYAAANNAGIAAARAEGAEAIVIANMDMAFDQSWLSELIGALDSDKNIGIVQSKILLYPSDISVNHLPLKERPLKINTLGNSINFLGFGFTNGYGDADRVIEGTTEIKGYASGSSLVITTELLDKIGGYNEEYYMYHDDLEMGWKTKLAGYKIVLAPKSVCYHKYEFSRSVKMIYYMERNRLLAIFTFYELVSILAIIPVLILMEMGMLFYSAIHGWFPQKVRTWAYFFRADTWSKIMDERKRIKNFRIVKDVNLIDDLEGEIKYQEIDNPLLRHVANPFFRWYWELAKKLIKG